MSDTTLYRLLTRPAADAAAAAGRLDPVPGLDVGFIHLSTLPQARGTAAAYFSSCGDLCMLPISASALAAAGLDLRYEEAAPLAGAAQRAGEFPHVFGGSIPWSCLAAPPIDLPLVDGKHAFPGDGMNRTLTGPDQQHSRSHLEKLLPSIGQICRSPFVVRVLDQPPSGAAGGDVKLVHWIRHGQGFHNLLSDLYKEHGIQGKPYLRPELHDPPLTAVGREQAVALRSTTQSLSPSLVVVSPLARATKTALLAFDHLVGRVPFLAHESCREISGVNACDGRRSVTEAQKDFPDVDYSLMPSDEDAFFDPAVRESQAALAERGYAFLAWLRSREEGEVAVGTHSAFLFALLNAAVVADDEPGTGLRAWFAAGELRSTWIRFEPS